MSKTQLESRLVAICEPLGLQCGLCRLHCEDPRNPPNTRTTGAPNAVMVWTAGKVTRVCWLWEYEQDSDEAMAARLKGFL